MKLRSSRKVTFQEVKPELKDEVKDDPSKLKVKSEIKTESQKKGKSPSIKSAKIKQEPVEVIPIERPAESTLPEIEFIKKEEPDVVKIEPVKDEPAEVKTESQKKVLGKRTRQARRPAKKARCKFIEDQAEESDGEDKKLTVEGLKKCK